MEIKNIMFEDLMMLDRPVTDQEAIIDALLAKALKRGNINQTADLKASIMERERSLSTAIGFKVAMPHGKSASVLEPFIGFVRTKQAFQWSDQNEEEVQMVFLIAVPEENRDNLHLKLISQLSRKLMHEDFRHGLLKAQTSQEIMQLLKEA